MTIGGDTGYQQCLYGSEPNAGTTVVEAWLDNSVLPEAILTLLTDLAPWALIATVASMVAIDVLCNTEPPQPQPFTVDDFAGFLQGPDALTNGTGQQLIDKLQANILYYGWKQYCQCKPQPAVCDHCGPCSPGVTESLTGGQTEVLSTLCCTPYCWIDGGGEAHWLCDFQYNFGTTSLTPAVQISTIKIQLGPSPTTGFGYTSPGNNFAIFNPTSGAGATGILTQPVDFTGMVALPQLTMNGLPAWSVTMHNVFIEEVPASYVGCPDVVQPPVTEFPTPPPGPTCSLDNICLTLQDILQRLQNLGVASTTVVNNSNSTSTVVNQTNTTVENILNNGAPNTYGYGAIYTLSGDGLLDIASGTLGLLVKFVSVPDWIPPTAGDPLAYYNLGWINLGNSDGWFSKQWIHYDGQLIFPPFSDISQVGYSLLTSGATITVQELVPANWT